MRPYTRRRLLLATAAALTATAGCSGDGTGGGDGDTGSGNTPTPTATADDPTTPACASWQGAPTRYDASGTPFVFSYDYVETWNLSEISDDPRGHLQRLTSPPVGDNDVTMTVRISQSPTPLTVADRDEEIQYLLGLDSEPRVVVDELTYDGESLRVLGLHEADVSLYQPGYTVFLPHGTGAARRYYSVGTTAFGSVQVDDDDLEACVAAVDDAQSMVIASLEPNPATTFDGA